MLDVLKAAYKRIDALPTNLESLEDFISLNVGVTQEPTISLFALKFPEAANAPVPTKEDFRIVRINVSPRRRIVSMNCFQILEDTGDDDSEEVKLAGDSIVNFVTGLLGPGNVFASLGVVFRT